MKVGTDMKRTRMFASVSAVIISVSALLTSCAQATFDGDLRVRYDYNLKEYLKPGKYSGLEVYIGDTNVSTEEIDNSVKRNRVFGCDWIDITYRPCKDGDIIGIAYQGYLAGDGDKKDRMISAISKGFANGEPMDELEGSQKVLSVVVGSDDLFPGFDDQVTGQFSVGERKTLTYTLPDPCWQYPAYAGETIELDVICTYIQEIIYPEDGSVMGYDSEESYRASAASTLQRTRNEQIESYVNTRVWIQIHDNFKVKKYPEKELEEAKNSILAGVEESARKAEQTLEEYVKEKYYQTVDEFNAAVQKQAEEKVKDEMIVYYIARQEKMAITDSVYSEKALEIAQDEGYGDLDMYIAYRAYSLGYLTTDEEVTDEIKQKAVDNLKETILRNMVDDFVYENTVQATTKK